MLPDDTDLDRLFLLPTSGTKLYRHRERWEQVYAEVFTDEERARILGVLSSTVSKQGLDDAPGWGEKIEDRGGQITFSALGQQAPLDAKQAWDRLATTIDGNGSGPSGVGAKACNRGSRNGPSTSGGATSNAPITGSP